MSRVLAALLLCATPCVAKADAFQRLPGLYGDPHPVMESCEWTRQRLTLSQDSQRGAIEVLVLDVDGQYFVGSDIAFTIRRTTPDGAEIEFDDDDGRTPSGALVVWELRLLINPDRYCWHRTDWPADQCINMVQRCEEPVPIS